MSLTLNVRPSIVVFLWAEFQGREYRLISRFAIRYHNQIFETGEDDLLTHFHIQFCLHHQFIIDKQVHVSKQMDTHDDRRLHIDVIS